MISCCCSWERIENATEENGQFQGGFQAGSVHIIQALPSKGQGSAETHHQRSTNLPTQSSAVGTNPAPLSRTYSEFHDPVREIRGSFDASTEINISL